MRRLTLLAILLTAAFMSCRPASCGILTPHQVRGSINLRPYGSTAAHNVTFWKNTVYMGGAATSGAGPNVWSIDVTDRYNLAHISGAGTGYKAYGVKAVEDRLYAASWFEGLRIFDISTGILNQLGEYDPVEGAFWHLDVANERTYLAQGTETTNDLRLIDVSNVSSPSLISQMNTTRLGGLSARGSYVYTTNHNRFDIINVSNEAGPYVMSGIDYGRPLLGGVRVRGDYAYLYWNGIVEGGIYVIDVSDPTNPVEVGSYLGECATDMCLLGDYAFYTTSGNGFMTIDISNPTNPVSVAQTNMYGYELCVTGNGRYVYVGSLAGENEGWLYAVEAFTSDPDDVGPEEWSEFSLCDASWDTQYEGDALPTASDPAWTVAEGTESLASVNSGILRVNDNSSAAKVKWARNWNATSTRGATVLVRARCASYDTSGGSITTLNNILLEDGKHTEEFAILSDKIRANRANLEAPIDGTQWHTYRITTVGLDFRVYVDESPVPVLTGPLLAPAQRSRVLFGSGSTLCKQDIYFDYVHCFSNGVFSPSISVKDTTPDITVNVADTAGKGSLSGIDPATVQVHWSTDGGAAWNTGGCTVTCDPVGGLPPPDRGVITAYGVPYNQYSETQNKIRFSLQDLAGNTGYSPIYNVRIDPDAGPVVTCVSSSNPDGVYRAGAVINVLVTFSHVVQVAGRPLLELETGSTDREAYYSSGKGTDTLLFKYVVRSGDITDDLDYTSVDALDLNGGTIKDVYSNDAHVTLPAPGAPCSLGESKDIAIDAIPPTVSYVSPPSVPVTRTGPVSYTVNFSEPVFWFTSASDIQLNVTDTAMAGSIEITGSDAGPYTVALSDISGGGTLGITVKQGACADAAGNGNEAGSPSSTFTVLAEDGSIAAAKFLPDGDPVELGNKALYLKWDLFGYVEEPTRSCGIRIEGAITADQGDLVCLTGTMQTTSGGERYILVDEMACSGTSSATPLGVNNRSLKEDIMTGLYVKAWGVVKTGSITGNSFVITDGSDDSGVKVITFDPPGVSQGEFVTVAGAAGYDGARVIYKK